MHLILVISCILAVVYSPSKMYNDTLGETNDTAKYMMILIVYCTIIIESNARCEIKKKLWIAFRKIDEQYCNHRNFKMQNYSWKFAEYFSAVSISYFLYLRGLLKFAGGAFLYFWFPHVFLMLLYQHRAFYYLFYLDLIENELRTIERELKMTIYAINDRRDHRNSLSMKFERGRLKWIREYYELVYEISDCMNSVFGWSNLATISFSCLVLTTDINWLYWKWYNESYIYIFGKFHC